AAVEDAGEGFVVRLRGPAGDEVVPLHEAADPQPLRVRRTAAEAGVVGRVSLLDRGLVHEWRRLAEKLPCDRAVSPCHTVSNRRMMIRRRRRLPVTLGERLPAVTAEV